MKITLRSICHAGGGVLGVLALGACAIGGPDSSDTETAQEEQGLLPIGQDPEPPPPSDDPYLPVWGGGCYQGHATYIVKRSSGSCSSISTTGGTWNGCNLLSGVSNTFCIYKWSSASPPVEDAYNALEEVADHNIDGHRIVPDCSSQRVSCGFAPVTGSRLYTCGSPQECCEMAPGMVWSPSLQRCLTKFDAQPSCDVCGFIRSGTLTAVKDPLWPDATRYTVSSGGQAWTVSAPTGTQTFNVPVTSTSFSSTAVTIKPAP